MPKTTLTTNTREKATLSPRGEGYSSLVPLKREKIYMILFFKKKKSMFSAGKEIASERGEGKNKEKHKEVHFEDCDPQRPKQTLLPLFF